jgi:glycosyltransferase involved in cell wall biosynthesis
MEISIIVPVYNTEKYIEKCIASLIQQNFSSYEILLINDSSPDNSQLIIDKYKKKYPHLIKSFIKKNGGLSDARNFGLMKATGKYILFVDSDDYIKENSLSSLYTIMEKKSLDILVFDFIKVYNEIFIHEKSMNNNSILDYILSTPNACNKMFKRSLFLDNNIFFPNKIWYEDLAIIPGFAKFTQKIDYLDEGIYFYVNRTNSIMNQKSYNNKFLDIIKSIQNLDTLLRNNFYDELEYLSIQHLIYGASLKILPYKKWNDMNLCVDYYIQHFSTNWNKNKYFETRPLLYRFYITLLFKRRYKICNFLLLIKTYMANKAKGER